MCSELLISLGVLDLDVTLNVRLLLFLLDCCLLLRRDINFYFFNGSVRLHAESDLKKFLHRGNEVSWVLDQETRVQQGHVVKKGAVLLDSLLDFSALSALDASEQLLYNGVMRVELEGLLCKHVRGRLFLVGEGLGTIDLFHLS